MGEGRLRSKHTLVTVRANSELPSHTHGGSGNKEQEPLRRRRRQNREWGLSALPLLPVPALLLRTCSQASGSTSIYDLEIMTTYSAFGQAATHQTVKMLHALLGTEQEELFIQESSGATQGSPPHSSPTCCTHLRPSIDEEHSGVLLSRLQIVRFVHHPIERKPRGALKGEDFWRNVVRKRACHRREQRGWFNRERMNNTALLQPCPITNLTAIPVELSHAFQWMWLGAGRDWECPSPRGAFSVQSHSHPCSPLSSSSLIAITGIPSLSKPTQDSLH